MSDVNSVMAPDAPQHRLGYDGRGGDIAKIALWNGFLTIVTLGIFRFWAKTRMRRYVWSRFSFDGDRVEYTGTGGELFKGFVVALLLFLAFAIPIRLTIVFSEPTSWIPQVFGGLYTVVILVLVSIAPFFAHRYRLTRTRWRGIRGGMQAKLWPYFGRVIGYGLLTFVTLGVAYPIGSVGKKRYLWNHSRFGTAPINCDAKVGRAWLPWLIQYAVWVAFIGLVIWFASRGSFFEDYIAAIRTQDPNDYQELGAKYEEGFGFGALAYLIVLAVSTGTLVAYYLRELRQILSSLTVAGVKVVSRLRARSMLWRIVIIALLQAIMAAVVIGLVFVSIMDAVTGQFWYGWIPIFIAAYIAIIVVSVILVAVLWSNPLYRMIATTTTVVGNIDMVVITQNTDAVPTRGEGLMELFSIDA